MIDALTKFKTSQSKAQNEAKFNVWANKKENKEKFGNVVATINNYYKTTNDKSRHDNYLQIMFRASEFAKISKTLGAQLEAYAKSDDGKKSELYADLKASIDDFFNGIYLPAENEILTNGLNLYAKKAGYKLVPSVESANTKYNGDFKSYVNNLFALSFLTSKERVLAFLEIPNVDQLTNDPLMKLSTEMLTHINTKSDELAKLQNDFGKAYRLLVDGMRQSGFSPVKYPDANSTLRLTYGKVSALPADKRNDAKVNYYTTLQGTIKKYKPNDDEFDLPKRLIELNEKKDFGEYADKSGYMPVNFLTNNDITGGNSGSPVLNGKGELIGLAFDGNIEAMAGDVIFDSKLQKTINVDIRYVLFIIDKFAGAKHIVDEMTIIR
jgi:hypothetical protein